MRYLPVQIAVQRLPSAFLRHNRELSGGGAILRLSARDETGRIVEAHLRSAFVTIVVVGLNYRTAPVEIREKLTLSGCALQIALEDLRVYTSPVSNNGKYPLPRIDEAAILSTCNRLEVYISTHNPDNGIALVEQFLSGLQNISMTELKGHLYNLVGDDALQHLMRVACGLDSMILGETQILGQVTQAFEEAHNAGITGPILSHLFAQVIHAGKRARTETPISRYTTSVSHAGVSLLMEKLNQRRTAHVVIIGAGEMATLAVQALKRFEVNDLVFLNRTYSRAEVLANDFGGKAFTWHQLEESLVWADAVICATGAPHVVIDRHDVEAVLQRRENRPLVIMDIAVPRDVEDTVRELSGVQVYDIDDLQSVVDSNVELRKAAIPQVKTIIQQEMVRFAEWYHSRQVTPVIKTLREWAQSIADEELVQALNRLSDADERTREIVSRMAHRLVNRLLHEPTSRLRIQASEGNGYGYAHAVRELFALNTLDTIECQQEGIGCSWAGQTAPAATTQCNLHCILPSTTGQQT
ncbi:glutamyl-tRNA reductase [Anaerolineae bacterium CFX8]|nr:glutamyl-tRNA reductase [Anaerolineae bacterium CFX8]